MDKEIVEKALEYARLYFKRSCLAKRHMESVLTSDEVTALETIPKELGMKPLQILEIAEKGRTGERTC